MSCLINFTPHLLLTKKSEGFRKIQKVRGKIQKAVEILKNGGIIIYPTDTCYGIGVDATNKEAIKKLISLKGRDFKKPISVIVKNFKMAQEIGEFNSQAEKIFKKNLPGPLTLIVKKKKNVYQLPNILTANKSKIGIRMPNNKIALELVKKFNKPITTTSANISNKPECYSKQEILKQFKKNIKNIDLILDTGKLPKTKPSTVIEIIGKKLKILRQGPIKIAFSFLGKKTQKQIVFNDKFPMINNKNVKIKNQKSK
ncbi:threonylcarbamoyl-AMP synthase [Candidatus Kuenenbacteria bacterium]|nr:threonylcarbamoyl-AMP synthase [Candidatus Kuenenbacteria bacterium]